MTRVAAVLLGMAAVLPAQAGYLLVLDSEPGDYIGGGIHQEFSDADGTFGIYSSGESPKQAEIRFSAPNYSHRWYLDFATAENRTLIPGPYEGATLNPFHSLNGNGLSVTGDGRACNELTGRFDVLEAERAPSGAWLRFAANFEQHCEGAAVALRGTIYYDASGPPFPPAPDTDGDGVFDSGDICIDVPDPDQSDADYDGIGDACDASYDVTFLFFDSPAGDYIGDGRKRTFTPADGRFTTLNWGNGIDISFQGDERWSLQLAAPPGRLLVPGVYEGERFGARDLGTLDFSGDGRGCNQTSGSFEVFEIETGVGGGVERLAVDFVQRCEGFDPPLIGSLRFNASPQFGELLDSDGDGVADIGDICADVADPDQKDTDLDGIGDACDPLAQAVFVLLDSEPGDYIGQGERQLYTTADAHITVSAGGMITASVEGNGSFGERWSLRFAPPDGGRLGVGSYPGATRWPFQSAGEPGLDVSRGGGCNRLTGRFDVLEYDVDARGRLRRFAADFEQHCEGGRAALRGSVRYGSSFYAASRDRDGDGVLDTVDSCPDAPDPLQVDANADGLGDACHQTCDADGNGAIDRRDIAAVLASLDAPPATARDVRDADEDGTISVLDGRVCALRCTSDGCAETSLVKAPEPESAVLGMIALLALSMMRLRRSKRLS